VHVSVVAFHTPGFWQGTQVKVMLFQPDGAGQATHFPAASIYGVAGGHMQARVSSSNTYPSGQQIKVASYWECA